MAIIAAVGAAFFFFIYQAITLGRKRRRKRETKDANNGLEIKQDEWQKSTIYWTAQRSKRLEQIGTILFNTTK